MKRTLFALALVASVATSGWAVPTVDLTTATSGTINNAVFEFYKFNPSGTGVFDPFLRIQQNGTEQGYNTDAKTPPFDAKKGVWTHSLSFSSLVAVGGYYQFALDIGEPKSDNNKGDASLLSLDGLKLFSTAFPAQDGTTVNGTTLYDMDEGGDHYVLLDAERGTGTAASESPGNGWSDMLLKIPVDILDNHSADQPYLILWSQFGLNEKANPGADSASTFEEWGTTYVTDDGGGPPQEVVPEPGTIMLLGTGLIGLALYGRRRIK